MPYKVIGNSVYVHKGGKWKLLKEHTSALKADAHRRALEANVKHKK